MRLTIGLPACNKTYPRQGFVENKIFKVLDPEQWYRDWCEAKVREVSYGTFGEFFEAE